MPQTQPTSQTMDFFENKHLQSLQLNRLIKYIENKKNPSFSKLKQTLIKDNPFTDRFQSNFPQIQLQKKRQAVAVSTKNIFIARNKTQISPSKYCQQGNHHFKIFLTKQQILKLHQKQKSHFLNSKYQINPIFNQLKKQQKSHSNLLPPLSLKDTRPNIDQYPGQSKKIAYSEAKTNRTNQYINNVQEDNKISKKQAFQLSQRQKYNRSLQKLIEKAFKSKQKYASRDIDRVNNPPLQNPYAEKDKLNPKTTKVRKDMKLKGQNTEILNKILEIDQKANNISINFDSSTLKLDREAIFKPVLSSAQNIKKKPRMKPAELIELGMKRLQKSRQMSPIQSRPLQKLRDKIDRVDRVDKVEKIDKIDGSSIEPSEISRHPSRPRVRRDKKPCVKQLFGQKTSSHWQIQGYQKDHQKYEQGMQLQQYVMSQIRDHQ